MNQPAHSDKPPAPPLGVALMIWAGVVVAIVGFIALGTWLELVPLYGGFTLLWYWANVDKLNFAMAPATVVGAIGGTATAWALQWGTVHADWTVAIAALAVLLVGLLLTILERAALVFNASYMLFVTVCCAPLLQKGEDFTKVVESILLGAIYFGGLVWIAMKVFGGSKAEQAAEARIGVEA